MSRFDLDHFSAMNQLHVARPAIQQINSPICAIAAVVDWRDLIPQHPRGNECANGYRNFGLSGHVDIGVDACIVPGHQRALTQWMGG